MSFYGVILGKEVVPFGHIHLLMFGKPNNFHKEPLPFEEMDFPSTYHALLRRPCFTKFMAVPNYTYIKLKVLGPKGLITIDTNFQQAYHCN